jgi:hypothetical protein
MTDLLSQTDPDVALIWTVVGAPAGVPPPPPPPPPAANVAVDAGNTTNVAYMEDVTEPPLHLDIVIAVVMVTATALPT